LAVLTAIFIKQSAEQLAGRAALLPADTSTPHLGGPAVPDWLGVYATYHQTQLLVFVGALDDLLLIAAGLSAVAVLGALLLRSGPAPTPATRVMVAQHRPAPAVPVHSGSGQDSQSQHGAGQDGHGQDGAVGRDFVPNRAASRTGGPVQSGNPSPDLGPDTRARDT
jgi:hypothetical protein